MRKSIIAILSLVAMVACTNDVTVMTQTPAAITFEDSFVEVKTRAADDPSITTADIDAFDVWGFMDDPKGLMFDAQRVTKGKDGWTYSPLQYWTQDHNYFFYAVAPVNNADIVVNKDLNIEGLGTIDFTNTDGSVDLLYAEKQESTYNENVNADGHETIKLTFAHLLSKVKFTFTNDFPEGTSSLKIENIKISQAPSKGTVTLNDDNAGRTWKISDSNATLDFGHVNGGVALLPNESAECDYERLTIPADANVRYQIDFTATLYYGENVALKSEKTVYLEDQAFVIGKNYNITATIDHTNIAEDALEPIIFDVVEVEEWDLGEHNGKIDFENGGTQVNPDEPTVEEGYKLYFNNLANWTKVYAHIWANEGEDLGLTAVEWPGRELTETEERDGVTYYVFQLPATANGKTVNVVFNDGAGSQTKDLAGVAKENLFFDNYVEPVAPSEVILYLQPNANWNMDGARFAAYFFGNGETWVDMTLVEGETNIYAVTVPAGFEDVIFCRMNPSAADNNWNNKWNQTSDLKVPTDGTNLYTVAEGAWDKGAGTWSTYTPAVKPEPVALDAPVVATSVNVNVVTLTWEAVTGASHYTVQVDDDVEEVVNTTSYEFNGDYEVTYQFTVKAIAADKNLNLDSAATVVSATTEAAPAVEPEVLAELDADAYYIFKQATEMKGGKWYAIVYENKAATALTGNYGYIQPTEAASRANGISLPATCAFGFLTTDGGYTIQQFDGKYVYQTGTYDSFNVNANLPADGGVWSVSVEGNEYTITNNTMSKFVQYDPAYNSYGCYAASKGNLPTLYELVEVDNTPAILGVSPNSLSFAADGESKTITVSTYGVANLTVSESADWVSTSLAENIVTVTVDANSGEARETTLTLSYGEDSKEVTITQVAPSTGESYTVTYDFTQIDGFSSWSSSYIEHSVEYNEAIVCFEKANRQTTNITNMPVTKGNSVTLVAKNNATITAAAFECQQWTTKAQTITLYYSTDGGNTYTSTNITSTNFSIESSTLPEGTNAVKIGFSSTSNQVGIKSATITYK